MELDAFLLHMHLTMHSSDPLTVLAFTGPKLVTDGERDGVLDLVYAARKIPMVAMIRTICLLATMFLYKNRRKSVKRLAGCLVDSRFHTCSILSIRVWANGLDSRRNEPMQNKTPQLFHDILR